MGFFDKLGGWAASKAKTAHDIIRFFGAQPSYEKAIQKLEASDLNIIKNRESVLVHALRCYQGLRIREVDHAQELIEFLIENVSPATLTRTDAQGNTIIHTIVSLADASRGTGTNPLTNDQAQDIIYKISQVAGFGEVDQANHAGLKPSQLAVQTNNNALVEAITCPSSNQVVLK